jgi:hypothetical protein
MTTRHELTDGVSCLVQFVANLSDSIIDLIWRLVLNLLAFSLYTPKKTPADFQPVLVSIR